MGRDERRKPGEWPPETLFFVRRSARRYYSGFILRTISTVVLMALINSIFLTGCASVRGPTRLARLQETPAVEAANQLWNSVAFIPVLSSVEVDLTTGETLNGRFRSVDEQTLVLEQDGDLRSVPRAEIRRVLLDRGRHTGTGAWWGLGIGAVAGLVFVLGVDGGVRSFDYAALAVMSEAAVAGTGAGIGALIGSIFRNWTVIYETPVSGATN